MGVTADVSESAAPLDEGWSRLGEMALLLGLPIGMLVVSLLVLVNLSVGMGVQSVGRDHGREAVLIVYFLLMLPYSLAGGALEAVYGGRGVLPCCFLVMLGVAAGTVFPVLMLSELGLFSGTAVMWMLVGAGAAAQMTAAATALVLVRRANTARGLRAWAASG